MKKFLVLSLLLGLLSTSASLQAQSLDAIKEKVAELQAAGYSNEEIGSSKAIAQLLGAIKNMAEIKEAQNYLKQFSPIRTKTVIEKIVQSLT